MPEEALVLDALRMALGQRRPDAGLLAHAHGLTGSRSRKGDCWDNAVAERFFATLAHELLTERDVPSRQAARRAEPSSSASRSGTIASGGTRVSATSVRRSTSSGVRPHKPGVHQTGSSPVDLLLQNNGAPPVIRHVGRSDEKHSRLHWLVQSAPVLEAGVWVGLAASPASRTAVGHSGAFGRSELARCPRVV